MRLVDKQKPYHESRSNQKDFVAFHCEAYVAFIDLRFNHLHSVFDVQIGQYTGQRDHFDV